MLLSIFDRLADELFKNIFDGLKPEHLCDEHLASRIKQAVAKSIVDKQKLSGLHRVICELVLKDAEFASRHEAVTDRSIAKLQELISLANKANLTYEIDVEAA